MCLSYISEKNDYNFEEWREKKDGGEDKERILRLKNV